MVTSTAREVPAHTHSYAPPTIPVVKRYRLNNNYNLNIGTHTCKLELIGVGILGKIN